MRGRALVRLGRGPVRGEDDEHSGERRRSMATVIVKYFEQQSNSMRCGHRGQAQARRARSFAFAPPEPLDFAVDFHIGPGNRRVRSPW
jgi:hypothetical protein